MEEATRFQLPAEGNQRCQTWQPSRVATWFNGPNTRFYNNSSLPSLEAAHTNAFWC